MIRLTAEMQLYTGSTDTKFGEETYTPNNNISTDINATINATIFPKKPFIIGASKVGDGSAYYNSFDYFIGSTLSNENGEFDEPLKLQIISTKLERVEIIFDNASYQFPTELKVNGEIVTNDSVNFGLTFTNGKTNVTIEITKWNTPKFPVKIQSIFFNKRYYVNGRNLKSISGKIIERADISLPSWGVISNTGTIKLVDYNQEIEDYIEAERSTENIPVVIYLEDTISKKTEMVGNFQIKELTYENNNTDVSATLQDKLIYLQEINCPQRDLDISRNMLYIFNWLKSKLQNDTKDTGKSFEFNPLSSEVENIMKNTVWKYPSVSSTNYWAQFNKLCSACALYMFVDTNGKISFSYEFG